MVSRDFSRVMDWLTMIKKYVINKFIRRDDNMRSEKDGIQKLIKDYLEDDKMNYAIMIDGEWGTGKTYLYENTLLPIINESERKAAYISLYGTNSTSEISKEILCNFFGSKNSNKVKIVGKVVNMASKMISTSISAINMDFSSIIDTISDIEINNWLLCFDDLERCCVPINEVLGYINDLVEHNNCKVLIIANQKEIGKINLSKNLEGKYKIILGNRNLKTDNSKCDSNEINIEELKDKTKDLFSDDILYNSIKEKLIGLTIKYMPDIDTIFDNVIEKYSIEYRDIMKKYKNVILEIFKKKQCMNIRTLIFSISKFEKIYNTIMNKFKIQDNYIEEIIEDFLKYTIKLCIYYKNGGDIYKLHIKEGIEYIKFEDEGYSVTKAFKVINKLVVNSILKEEELKETIDKLIEQYNYNDIENSKYKKTCGIQFSKLREWWLMEDKEVQDTILALENEIQGDKYAYNDYPYIIGTLLSLKNCKFDLDIDKIVLKMQENIKQGKKKFIFKINKYGYNFEERELQNKYEECCRILICEANDIEYEDDSKKIDKILEDPNWSEEFIRYCKDNHSNFIERGEFINLLNINKLMFKIKNCKTKELYNIIGAFNDVYQATNIGDYLLNDLNTIQELDKEIKNICETRSKTKKIAIASFSEQLNKIKNKLH